MEQLGWTWKRTFGSSGAARLGVSVALLVTLISCNRTVEHGVAGNVLHVTGSYRRTAAAFWGGQTQTIPYDINVTADELQRTPKFYSFGRVLPVPEGAQLVRVTITIKNLDRDNFRIERDAFSLATEAGSMYGIWDQVGQLENKDGRLGFLGADHKAVEEVLPSLSLQRVLLFPLPESATAQRMHLMYAAYSADKSVPLFKIDLKDAGPLR